jgi:hypothetical protein
MVYGLIGFSQGWNVDMLAGMLGIPDHDSPETNSRNHSLLNSFVGQADGKGSNGIRIVMIRFLSFFLFLLVFMPGISPGQSSEEGSVRATFSRYKSAILHDNPDGALDYVASRTITYYDRILDLVRNAGEAQVKSLPLLDKLMVLTVRHKIDREKLLTFDGKALLEEVIRTGLLGKNSVANLSVGEVIVENEFARGQLQTNGTSVPGYFHFYREEEKWKIDLTSIFPFTSEAIRQMVSESGQDENDFLLNMIETASGKKPDPQIWGSLL